MKKIAALFLFLTFTLVGCTGQVGSTGPQGEPGTDGLNLLTGKGEPVASLGNVGDSYIDTETWDYYVKTNSGWVKQGNIKGQDGADGENGETGEQGPQGDKGEPGEAGKSAYELYCEEHPEYKGTLEEWLEDLANGNLSTVYHTVSFQTGTEQQVESQEVKHLGKASKPVDPERKGYTFDGWTYQGEIWSFAGYVVTEDMTLTANWKANTYHVTFDSTGGYLEQTEFDYSYGDDVTLPVPIKDDAVFLGWTYGDESVEDGPWSIDEDCTLIAAWRQDSYRLTYDIGYDGLTEETEVPYGEYIFLFTPVREGYEFLGWFDQEDNLITAQEYLWLHDVRLTAAWKAVETTVYFDSGEGYTEETSVTLTYGQEFKLPVPTGDNFNGWYYGDRQITDEAGKGLAPWDIATSEVVLEAFYFIPVYDDAGLRAMSEDLDGNYRLMNDVTLTGEWTPVGTEENPFTGSFDGCSHSIIGLSITESGGNYLGLFGYFSGSFVSNLDFQSAEIVASYPLSNQDASCAGVVAGYAASYADFSGVNVDASSSVSVERAGDRDSYVGGLVGDAFGCTVTSSSNSGNVSGSDSVGGLVGGGCTVTSSSNSGNVSGSDSVGGLVGYAYEYSTIESSSNSGDVTGSSRVGGLVGVASELIVSDSLAVCKITVNSTNADIGPIYGSVSFSEIANCHYLCEFILPDVFNGTKNEDGTLISSIDVVTQEFFSDTLGWDPSLWDFTDFDAANGTFPVPAGLPSFENGSQTAMP